MATGRASQELTRQACFRHIPRMLASHNVAEFNVKTAREALRKRFDANAHVKDIRVIDMLVIKGQHDLKEVVEHWAQPTHILSRILKPEAQVQVKDDFLSKFFRGVRVTLQERGSSCFVDIDLVTFEMSGAWECILEDSERALGKFAFLRVFDPIKDDFQVISNFDEKEKIQHIGDRTTCIWNDPNGRRFDVIGNHGEIYEYWPDGIISIGDPDEGECGIMLKNTKLHQSGIWKCQLIRKSPHGIGSQNLHFRDMKRGDEWFCPSKLGVCYEPRRRKYLRSPTGTKIILDLVISEVTTPDLEEPIVLIMEYVEKNSSSNVYNYMSRIFKVPKRRHKRHPRIRTNQTMLIFQ
ncbi:NDUFA6 [Lepeophtheirus salmonis]|uniref:NDUFA6 n=1 Tax=Lepeophtheirus salmonis TaxID=72036 RepID=A0A7R8GZ98_LEPSM|nr:NDUFA6 [Lepeophtheirus salmonis]CAF2749168.1 NDUFA6 [Lepeophtheirus salmonis]